MQLDSELSSDILKPIPLKEWPVVQELLKVDWPKNAFYYYWIQNSSTWKQQDPKLAIEIYCPHGRYKDDVTFVGISNFLTWTVIIFTEELSGKRLHEALVQTNRIDWSNEIKFAGVDTRIQPILYSALATLRTNQGIEINGNLPVYFYIKGADESANVNVEVPEGCYLGELSASHVSIIHPLWPYTNKEKPESSMKFLEASLTLNKGIGLFLKQGDILVSWALHNDGHGLGAVHTLKEYQRRGYAKTVVNALAKRLGQEGISPVLCVVCGNTLAENMFASLNWKRTVPAVWVKMKRHLK